MAVLSNDGAVAESLRLTCPWPTSNFGVALRRVDTIVQWIRPPARCLILGRKHQERFSGGDAMKYDAWVAKAARQPIVLESVDPGPLGAEDVEVAVEHCGLCHSDLSLLRFTLVAQGNHALAIK